ncbi:flagellar protein FlgN [Aquibacillus sp. 3ASR75-11]|uniref:Flagellar protein FlgN n=1 Tax=Terrihalobacillus insolitus TaxID=2950438 RepID=A0A9X4AKA8_9BACI|nr:flagellar protein FlgN [Terrihalobacillus insolitus]MDC3412224.1 flagellar protein FlgN [Terrihalobacillus insolitus]MDC3423082.1 flagellar protein FlgN [Terrihalobacillus insolitus]
MSVQPIIEIMENLTRCHQSLYELSKEKTETLKSAETDKLQSLLVKERKQVQAITQLEEKRLEFVHNWCVTEGLDETNPTVTFLLDRLDDDNDEKIRMETALFQLTDTLVQLKQQEQLNANLTQQSLQFIELSMDMLDPSLKNMNYGNRARPNNYTAHLNRSVFDSNA